MSQESSPQAPIPQTTSTSTTLSNHGYEEAPTASSDLVWRAEIVKQLFGDVGEVITDFTCAVESNILLHGRMYVTNRFLCFYSNLFGLEKKIRIPYSHISLITKENTALVIPNAIAITTYRKEYVFRSFWDRDEAFNMLKDLVNRYKGIDTTSSDSVDGNIDMSITGPSTRPVSESVTSITVESPAQQMNRRNSAPSIISETTTTTTQDQQSLRPMSTPHQNISSTTPFVSTPPPPTQQSQQQQQQQQPISTLTPSKDLPPTEPPLLKLKSSDDNELDTESGREELDRQRGSTLTSNTSEHLEAFEKDLASSKQKIQIKSVKIPITVTDFCQLFVVDGAKYGYPKYHEDSGDKEIVATSWEDDSTGLGSGREIRFLKPVAVPGLPFARAKKIQRYRRYGNVGVLVCSSTRMEDVPAADTFTVEDCVSARATGPREITIEANFDIKWIKSTFFRRMIEGGTLPDVTRWLENFLNTKMVEIAASCTTETTTTPSTSSPSTPSPSIPTDTLPPVYSKPTTVDNPPSLTPLSPPPSPSPFLSPLILYLIIGILILSLLFVGYQLFQMASNISQLRSQINQLTDQMELLSSHTATHLAAHHIAPQCS